MIIRKIDLSGMPKSPPGDDNDQTLSLEIGFLLEGNWAESGLFAGQKAAINSSDWGCRDTPT